MRDAPAVDPEPDTTVLTAPFTASVQAPVSSVQDNSANTARVPFLIEYSYAAWGDEFITICRKGGREREREEMGKEEEVSVFDVGSIEEDPCCTGHVSLKQAISTL